MYSWALQMFTKSLKAASVFLHPCTMGLSPGGIIFQSKEETGRCQCLLFFFHFLTATGSFPRQSCRSLSISLTTSSASTDSLPRSWPGWSSCSKTVPISLESRLALECTSIKFRYLRVAEDLSQFLYYFHCKFSLTPECIQYNVIFRLTSQL